MGFRCSSAARSWFAASRWPTNACRRTSAAPPEQQSLSALRQLNLAEELCYRGRRIEPMRSLDKSPLQMRRQELGKFVHVFAQQRAAAKTDPGDVRLKKMPGIERHKIRILARIDRHAGDDSDAKSQAHIGLDHVRITCGDCHVGHK